MGDMFVNLKIADKSQAQAQTLLNALKTKVDEVGGAEINDAIWREELTPTV